jgi:hypothetical protein
MNTFKHAVYSNMRQHFVQGDDDRHASLTTAYGKKAWQAVEKRWCLLIRY